MKDKRVLLNIFFFLLACLIAGYITYRVTVNNITRLDRWMEPYVRDLNEGGTLFSIFRWITELGSATFLVPFSLIMAYILWRLSHNWLIVAFFAGGAIVGPYMNTVIKNLVQRERPRMLESAEGVGYSFPSGHAMSGFIIYGLLIYFLTLCLKNQRLKLILNTIFIVLILLIGMSRYIIRVHHFSDVIAGFAYGFIFLVIWLTFFTLAYRRLYNEAPSASFHGKNKEIRQTSKS